MIKKGSEEHDDVQKFELTSGLGRFIATLWEQETHKDGRDLKANARLL